MRSVGHARTELTAPPVQRRSTPTTLKRRVATNPGARWLFPGRRASQPLHASHLSQLVRDLGIPALAGRTAALLQLVLQVPAPVVAQALGYHHSITTRVASEAGTPWSRPPPATTAGGLNLSDQQGIRDS
jgi:hypothetical protein